MNRALSTVGSKKQLQLITIPAISTSPHTNDMSLVWYVTLCRSGCHSKSDAKRHSFPHAVHS